MKITGFYLIMIVLVGMLLNGPQESVGRQQSHSASSLTSPVEAAQASVAKKGSLVQAKPEKKRTIEDLHREWDSANVAEGKLPTHLKKMGNLLRDHIQKMKSAGITRAKAKSKNVEKNFSTGMFHIDQLG